MKRIKVISLGGTIGMLQNEHGLAQPALNGLELTKGLRLGNQIELSVETILNVPSPYLKPRDILHLAERIRDWFHEGFHGVVITQGTDTLEETAYFLDLLVAEPIAVVLTGAQRNPSLLSADGPANLFDAILVAQDERSRQMGVLVVFCSEVYAAREVVKTHTTRLDSFKSPEVGPVAALSNDRVVWFRDGVCRETYQVKHLDARVEIISACIGSDSLMLDAVRSIRPDGVVLQGLGAGHVPPEMMPGIERLIQQGIPVVLTTRCHAGRLLVSTYGYEGSETHLRRMGVIFGDGLPTSKARVKLIVLLGAGMGYREIKEAFERRYYA